MLLWTTSGQRDDTRSQLLVQLTKSFDQKSDPCGGFQSALRVSSMTASCFRKLDDGRICRIHLSIDVWNLMPQTINLRLVLGSRCSFDLIASPAF